jgi:heterodisulfide reductase subunit B
MGTITCTCRHTVDNFNKTKIVSIASRSIDFVAEKFVNSVSYVTLCLDCYESYWKGHILETEQDEKNWTNGLIKIDDKYIW